MRASDWKSRRDCHIVLDPSWGPAFSPPLYFRRSILSVRLAAVPRNDELTQGPVPRNDDCVLVPLPRPDPRIGASPKDRTGSGGSSASHETSDTTAAAVWPLPGIGAAESTASAADPLKSPRTGAGSLARLYWTESLLIVPSENAA